MTLDDFLRFLARRMPRRLAYYAGLRILAEATRRKELSHIGRQVNQGEIRMLWALDQWVTR